MAKTKKTKQDDPLAPVIRELREAGLRRRVAKDVAPLLAVPAGAGATPPPEVSVLAERLRALAADLEARTTGEHAEPQASARRAAHRKTPAKPRAKPAAAPRARRT